VTRSAQSQEDLALRLSLVLTVLFGIAAVAIALLSDSQVMTLEAMTACIDVVVCILAIFVARKVHEPANERYQFGYAKYEPLMTTVEGVLLAGACVGAIIYSVQDIIHPDPVESAHVIVIYQAASFLLSVIFGWWMKRVGVRSGSPLVRAEAELWVVDGWLALGVTAAFVASIALGRIGTQEASAYVDPAVCIVLSVIFLRKPYEILRDSVSDLVDANPYADTVNAVEESAGTLAERFHLEGVEWVRVRKAGRREFVMVSFFVDPGKSLEAMDNARQSVTQEMASLHPDVEVTVLFRSAPAK
jgi:cation diffusion facilitator family transporter